MFIKEPVVINIPSNMFTKQPTKIHSGGLLVDNQAKKRTGYDLSNQELIEGGFTNLLERQLVEEILVNIVLAQINDV